MAFLIICFSVLCASLVFKRADVAITLIGYLVLGSTIVISLFFSFLYLYTDFVAGLLGL